jgi:hypothetical protein
MRDPKMMLKSIQTLALGAICLAAVGCGGDEPGPMPDPLPPPAGGTPTVGGTAPTGALPVGTPVVTNMPGIPVAAVADPDKIFKAEGQLVASRYGAARRDPFALKAPERSYEVEQNSARLLNDMGSWSVMYTPPAEKPPAAGLIQDPQPYRRLSGIIVGDSINAILDSGDGSPVIIRPGMRVPNTEWTVVSIDEEKAILRRTGNKVPRQITVRLESPPPGMGGGNTGGAPGGPSGPPGGPPGPGNGMGPGGRPGAAGPGSMGPGAAGPGRVGG